MELAQNLLFRRGLCVLFALQNYFDRHMLFHLLIAGTYPSYRYTTVCSFVRWWTFQAVSSCWVVPRKLLCILGSESLCLAHAFMSLERPCNRSCQTICVSGCTILHITSSVWASRSIYITVNLIPSLSLDVFGRFSLGIQSGRSHIFMVHFEGQDLKFLLKFDYLSNALKALFFRVFAFHA